MARLFYAPIAFALALPLALTACSSKNSANNPDAPVVITTDAPPPDAGIPDALVCTAPQKDCGSGACVDTSSDEQNCGDCNVVCKGGAYCKAQPDGCTCPAAFIPSNIPSNPLDVHQVQSIGGTNIHIAAAPLADGGQINALIFIDIGLPTAGQDYTLKSGISFSQPNVLAAYNAQLGGAVPTADAYYDVTAGTLHFTSVACDTNGFEYKGTIKAATFQGATFTGMNIQVDPAGCTFDVANIAFDIAVTGACTP